MTHERHWRRSATIATGFALGLGMLVLFAFSASPQAQDEDDREYQAFVAQVARDGTPPPPPTPIPPPTPTPTPIDYGPPRSMTLASAFIPAGTYIEQRHTRFTGGQEFFDEPSNPRWIAWYHRFSTMGRGGQNTIFSAHINYVGIGNGPFRYLTSARVGDSLSITMDNGQTLRYSVQSVQVISLANLNMDRVVYPGVPSNRERITLISCGGTFVPRPGGGGDYDSRVILVAERIIS
jgi:hypothetical protein